MSQASHDLAQPPGDTATQTASAVSALSPTPGADRSAEAGSFGAFISYRHVAVDRRFAKWLHASLETFRTPGHLAQQGARPRVGKVFRDEEELAASPNLSAEIDAALKASDFLVVICSPRTPESKWVNEEIKRFRELGRGQRILACLIEGEPAESFPPALLSTLEDGMPEPLAADFRRTEGVSEASTHRLARLKLLSTLLGCRFDDLVVREQARRRRLQIIGTSALLTVLAVISVLALLAVQQRNEARAQRAVAVERRDATLLTQSRFLASLSEQATEAGNASLAALLALEALPRQWHAAERPYHPPAMGALYRAVIAQRELLTFGGGGADAAGAPTPYIHTAAIARDALTLVVGTTTGTVEAWDIGSRRRLHSVKIGSDAVRYLGIGATERQVFAAVGSLVFDVDLDKGSSRKVITVEDEIESLSSHQDGHALVIVTATVDTAQVRLWTRGPDGFKAHPAVSLARELLYHYTASPDGRRMAFGDARTPYLVLADLETGTVARLEAPQFKSDQGTLFATFSPAGDGLLVSSSRNTLLFDLARRSSPIPLVGHYDTVLRAAISPDRDHVATGSEDGRVLLWSKQNHYARPVRSFDGFVRGANLALVEGPEIARVLHQNRRMHDDFEGAVGHLAFSADGQRLLATSGDRSVSVFDVDGGKRVVRLSGHDGRIDAVAITADGGRIFTVDRERIGRVWRTTADRTILLFRDVAAVTAAVLPAGADPPVALVKHAGTGCGGLWRAWHFLSGTSLGVTPRPKDIPTTPGGIGTLSLDGSTLLTGYPETGFLNRVDPSTGQVDRFALPAGGAELDCAFADNATGEVLLVRADGREVTARMEPLAAVGTQPRPSFLHPDLVNPGSLHWVLSAKGSPTPAAAEPGHDPQRFSFGRGGARLLVWRRDGTVALLDAKTGRQIRRFILTPDRPAGAAGQADGQDFAFSDDGLFVTSITPASARVWKAEDGSLVREVASSSGAPAFVVIGGVQRSHLIIVEKDGRVYLHDLEGKRAPAVLAETFLDRPTVKVSPDGRRLVVESGDRSCPSLWDVDSQRKLAVFSVSAGCAHGLKFSPDGRALVSVVTQPQGIAVWEAEGGEQLARHGGCLPDGVQMFDADPSDVMASGFSDDGRHVFAGTLAGALCVWAHPGAGDALVENAKAQLSRGFSKVEHGKYPIQATVSATPGATTTDGRR